MHKLVALLFLVSHSRVATVAVLFFPPFTVNTLLLAYRHVKQTDALLPMVLPPPPSVAT